MKHTYNVTGMTCNGCKESVQKYIDGIDGVSNAAVDLENGVVSVTMEEQISLSVFKDALPPKYTISQAIDTNNFVDATLLEDAPKSKLAQLSPLFLIMGYLLIAAILLNYKTWSLKAFVLDFMGLFFIVFSFFKLLDVKGFRDSFRMYDPLAKAIPGYAWLYPFIETALGLMLLLRFELTIALIATIVILGITTIGVTRSLLGKKKITCACLGTALKLPMTEATFIENTLMIIMAVIMLLKLV